ncbi:MAG: hypothetical protein WKF59_03265 [Chitinophagaceae bacterium]
MNKTWLPHPIILTGKTIDLIPLKKEHIEELYIAASDKKLWELIPTNCSERKTFLSVYNASLTEREKGNEYPFIIYHKLTKKLLVQQDFLKYFLNIEN